MGSAVRTSAVVWRSVWLSVMTSWRRPPARGAARTGQPVVGGQQLADLAGHPDPGRGEHDEIVADPLDVRDQV